MQTGDLFITNQLVVGHLPICPSPQLIKTHLGRPIKRKSRVVNLYIYIMESLNKMIKIPLRFYYIFKKEKNDTFYTSLELSILEGCKIDFFFLLLIFVSFTL